jgi:hypothetical protein
MIPVRQISVASRIDLNVRTKNGAAVVDGDDDAHVLARLDGSRVHHHPTVPPARVAEPPTKWKQRVWKAKSVGLLRAYHAIVSYIALECLVVLCTISHRDAKIRRTQRERIMHQAAAARGGVTSVAARPRTGLGPSGDQPPRWVDLAAQNVHHRLAPGVLRVVGLNNCTNSLVRHEIRDMHR